MRLSLLRRMFNSNLRLNAENAGAKTTPTASAEAANTVGDLRLNAENAGTIPTEQTTLTASAETANTVAKGSEDRFMRRVDLTKDWEKLKPVQKIYIQKLNALANEQFSNQKKAKRNQRIGGAIFGTIVLSIYFYSMYAIKQEKFLDDFNIPEPPNAAAARSNKAN